MLGSGKWIRACVDLPGPGGTEAQILELLGELLPVHRLAHRLPLSHARPEVDSVVLPASIPEAPRPGRHRPGEGGGGHDGAGARG